MQKIKTIIFLLIISQISFSQKATDRFKNNELLKNANISLMIKNLSNGKVLADLNSHNSLICASTLKTITTASALELLGEDYTIKTTLEIDGNISSKGILNGDLIVKAAGDPTLGSEKSGDKDFFAKWINAIKQAGIQEINGNIAVCESCFEKQLVNPGWTWEDMGNYYAPAIHALSYSDNTCKVVFQSGNTNTTPQILRTEPAIQGLKFRNYVKSTATKSDNAYFYGIPYINERSIFGEIPANRNEFISKTDIPHPAEVFLKDFKTALDKNNIRFKGDLLVNDDNCRKFIIYTHNSPKLSEICTEINHQSNNHYAEYIFKQLSIGTNSPGNNQDSKSKINNYWKSKGLSTNELFQYDGSGLSPTNAVSANFFVELLSYMYSKSKSFNAFYNTLPVSGESGTLKNFLSSTTLKGKVHAKSGTISRVKSYVGYIKINDQTLAFAVLVNNANGSSKEVTSKIENLLVEVSSSFN